MLFQVEYAMETFTPCRPRCRKRVQQRALLPPAQGLPHRRPCRGRPRGPHHRRPRLLAGLTTDGRVFSRASPPTAAYSRGSSATSGSTTASSMRCPSHLQAHAPPGRQGAGSCPLPDPLLLLFSAGFASICPYAHVFIVEESDTIYDFVLRV
jgi:hypothetical protein